MADNPEQNSKSRLKGSGTQLDTLNSKDLSNSSMKHLYSMSKSPRWSEPKRYSSHYVVTPTSQDSINCHQSSLTGRLLSAMVRR